MTICSKAAAVYKLLILDPDISPRQTFMWGGNNVLALRVKQLLRVQTVPSEQQMKPRRAFSHNSHTQFALSCLVLLTRVEAAGLHQWKHVRAQMPSI